MSPQQGNDGDDFGIGGDEALPRVIQGGACRRCRRGWSTAIRPARHPVAAGNERVDHSTTGDRRTGGAGARSQRAGGRGNPADLAGLDERGAAIGDFGALGHAMDVVPHVGEGVGASETIWGASDRVGRTASSTSLRLTRRLALGLRGMTSGRKAAGARRLRRRGRWRARLAGI